MTTYLWFAAILASQSFAIYQLSTIGRSIMATQQQVDALTDTVASLTTQVTKVGIEVTAVQDELAKAVAAAANGNPIDLTALTAQVANAVAAVQAVDDLNPDTVVEEPVTDEPVTEEPVVDPVDPVVDPDPVDPNAE